MAEGRLQDLVSEVQEGAILQEVNSWNSVAQCIWPGTDCIPFFKTSNLNEEDEGREWLLKFLAEFETQSILPVQTEGESEFSIYKGYVEEDEYYLKLFGSVTNGKIVVGQKMLIGPGPQG